MDNILENELVVINIGIIEFAEALREQQVPIVHVDWRPSTKEDEELENLLESLI
jgi:hypothetical protein